VINHEHFTSRYDAGQCGPLLPPLSVLRERGPEGSRSSRRRGTIYILALGIIVVLSGMLLVFAQNMATESIASANRTAYAKADAIEQGAEQWVLAQCDTYPADALTITQTPAEALQVGDGYFWVICPDDESDQTYMAGIVDESGKLNINKATSAQLQTLPGVEEDVGDSIVNWASTTTTASNSGAESDYYEQLPEPYEAKNAAFETTEELNLIEDVTPDLLFGYDANRNGVIEPAELSAAGDVTAFENANGNSRGIFDWLTAYSVEPNTSTSGTKRVNVNTMPTTALTKVLTTDISASRSAAIMRRINPLVRARPNRAFANLGAFYIASGMTPTEFGEVYDYITATTATTLTGLINVNTAPLEVLECLPGLTEADAQTLIASRATSNNSVGIGWVFTALANNTKAAAISGSITARSYQYSADIVAVSGDGRSFKRVRIVVDSTTPPTKVVYREDLTSYGWPLAPGIREAMQAGHPPPTGVYGSSANDLVNGLTQ
jgi:DNA uptake protein ComE-like DNA-binding protein